MQVDHKITNEDLIRISSFLEHTNTLFESVEFIKNFEVLNILLFIHRRELEGKDIRFKDLQKYVKKSDVYLGKLLKNGLETNYLSISRIEGDKRIKHYHLTEKTLSFFQSLGFQADYPSDLH
jgi:YesN/AraC family two-component response regulator|tara:strand:+ start:1722 stop:2087 length:366 start_codon:yes stop_codon:yes gene_type:complete